MNQGSVLLISGPSGCGKSTLLKELYKNIDEYYFSISTTTRSQRVGEEEGKDYWFVSTQQFEEDIKNDQFLEWALVHGHYYGTSLKPVLEALNQNKLVIFDIDVQGFHLVRERLKDLMTSVFITTPSLNELAQRLRSRKTDHSDTIDQRLLNAQQEVESFQDYDYLLVNNNLEETSQKLLSIVRSSRLKSTLFSKEDFLRDWKC